MAGDAYPNHPACCLCWDCYARFVPGPAKTTPVRVVSPVRVEALEQRVRELEATLEQVHLDTECIHIREACRAALQRPEATEGEEEA